VGPGGVLSLVNSLLSPSLPTLVPRRSVVHSTEYSRVPCRELTIYNKFSWNEDPKAVHSGQDRFVAKNDNLPTDLLRACRQVYHEGTGVLYAKKEFLVFVAPHHHSPSCRQFQIKVHWLRSVGSKVELLQNISIDVGSACSERYKFINIGIVNLKPLVRLL
jgi:hypothetical protein